MSKRQTEQEAGRQKVSAHDAQLFPLQSSNSAKCFWARESKELLAKRETMEKPRGGPRHFPKPWVDVGPLVTLGTDI